MAFNSNTGVSVRELDRFDKANNNNKRVLLLSSSLSIFVGGESRMSWSLCSTHSHGVSSSIALTYGFLHRRSTFRICATSDGLDPKDEPESPLPSSSSALGKDLKKVVNKTAATFAPRASTASKNPALPGTTLYKVFEVQGYASMLLGGVLSFNLLFPSNEPDLWRLMGMWSIWMFTIPSLRARDCPIKEKEALNYLFLIIPLLNVAIPFFWKSFALVWSADTVTFFAMYAWKLGWLESTE